MRELIDTAQIPGGDELRLYRRGDDFIIAIGGNELMNSRMSGSEEALAVMSCARLRRPETARLLIGGYGMGFTLRAALATLGPAAQVVSAELTPALLYSRLRPQAALAPGWPDRPPATPIHGPAAAGM